MPSLTQSPIRRWWFRFWCIGRRLPISSIVPVKLPVTAESRPATPEPVAVDLKPSVATVVRADADTVRTALAEMLMGPVEVQAATALAGGTVDQVALRATTLSALNELRQIPSLHSLARGFTMTANRDGVSVDEVVESIGKDPALCVRVLRMANSAFIGPANRIDDLPSAVQMLGVVRIRSLVQMLYTLRDSRAIAPGFDWRHLWLHALATAALSEEIERELGLRTGPLLYLAALLHDVGKIVLSVIAPEGYRDILLATWQDSRPLEEMERERFGLTHREAGEVYLRQNNLSEAVLATVAHHNAPAEAPEEHRVIAAVVSIANYVSKTYGLGFSGAMLTTDDGEFEDLPAWRVLEPETGRMPDIAALEERLKACIPAIKTQLLKLRDGVS